MTSLLALLACCPGCQTVNTAIVASTAHLQHCNRLSRWQSVVGYNRDWPQCQTAGCHVAAEPLSHVP